MASLLIEYTQLIINFFYESNKKIFSLTILIVILSCHSDSSNKFTYSESEYSAGINGLLNMKSPDASIRYELAPISNSSSKSEQTPQKLIRKGYAVFETESLEATRKIVLDAVKKYNGYISSDKESKTDTYTNNSITIRVPEKNFDLLLNDATIGIIDFDEREIDIKDVTAEFLDVSVRLNTKKELELRYLELLKKAKNVVEMLDIEREIGKLRADIESSEGQLKYLQDRVSFSTLNLVYYKVSPRKTKFGSKFSEGFKNGWDNLIWFFVGLINVWPFVIVFIILSFLFVKWRKNRKKSK